MSDSPSATAPASADNLPTKRTFWVRPVGSGPNGAHKAELTGGSSPVPPAMASDGSSVANTGRRGKGLARLSGVRPAGVALEGPDQHALASSSPPEASANRPVRFPQRARHLGRRGLQGLRRPPQLRLPRRWQTLAALLVLTLSAIHTGRPQTVDDQ